MSDAAKQAYSDMVGVVVSNFLYQVEKYTRVVWIIRDMDPLNNPDLPSDEGPIGKFFELVSAGSVLDSILIRVDVDGSELIRNTVAKAEDFCQRSPSDGEWKAALTYLDTGQQTVPVKPSQKAGDFVKTGATVASVALSSILAPATGGLSLAILGLGAIAVGGGVGAKASQKLRHSIMTENKHAIETVKSASILKVQAQKQNIIDAILAANY